MHFAALQVLKVDNNPIEWPVSKSAIALKMDAESTMKPPHILELGSLAKDTTRSVEEQMRVWIAGLKAWMKEDDEQEQIRKAALGRDEARQVSAFITATSALTPAHGHTAWRKKIDERIRLPWELPYTKSALYMRQRKIPRRHLLPASTTYSWVRPKDEEPTAARVQRKC